MIHQSSWLCKICGTLALPMGGAQIVGRLKVHALFLRPLYTLRMAKLVLDLHDIFQNGKAISEELGRVIREACEKRIPLVEIIPGKGSGQLKRRVIRFLNQPHIKELYHRLEKDDKNHGRIFVHFRHKR